MSTSQQQKPPRPGPWQRLRWRWKLTVAGLLMGAHWHAACGPRPPPGSPFRGGYMTHGYIYAASVAVVMVLAPVGMHLMGIRDEKDFDETEIA